MSCLICTYCLTSQASITITLPICATLGPLLWACRRPEMAYLSNGENGKWTHDDQFNWKSAVCMTARPDTSVIREKNDGVRCIIEQKQFTLPSPPIMIHGVQIENFLRVEIEFIKYDSWKTQAPIDWWLVLNQASPLLAGKKKLNYLSKSLISP